MKKRGSKRILLLALGILLVLVVAVIALKGSNKTGKRVAADVAETRDIVELVSASGKLYPEVEVEITSNISGTIVELLVEEGDSIKENQLLARVDPDALASVVERTEAAVKSAQAQYENARAQKEQFRAQLQNATQVHTRNTQLFNEGVIAKAELETSAANLASATANLDAAEQSIQSARYNVESARATVKEQRENLSRTAIYSPISGVVSKTLKKQGEQVVGTAQMAGTPILRVANFSEIEMRVKVSENDILRVAMGDTAELMIDAYPDETFIGTVTQIPQSAIGTSSTTQLSDDQVTNFEVKIRVLRSSYDHLVQRGRFPFLPGMSGSADIRTQTVYNVLSVPIAAVTTRSNEEEEDKDWKKGSLREVVFVAQGDSVIEREVKTGIQDDRYFFIEKGLQAGDSVIVAPYRAVSKELKSGDKIFVVDKKALYSAE